MTEMTTTEPECASCAQLREELRQAYTWGEEWRQRDQITWTRLREEIGRNDRAEAHNRELAGRVNALINARPE